jgi:hypothetical protein
MSGFRIRMTLTFTLAAVALPSTAGAAVHCVGTSGGDCDDTFPTSVAAEAAANGGDTIRYGAGTFDPVFSNEVLTFQGVGPGTPDSAAGATFIEQTTDDNPGIRLDQGGTIKDLRVVGGDASGTLLSSGGPGIQFTPSNPGNYALTVSNVIALGGQGGSLSLAGSGLFVSAGSANDRTAKASVTGSLLEAGGLFSDFALGVSLSGPGAELSLTDTTARGQDAGLQVDNRAKATLERSNITSSGFGVQVLGSSLTATRSRITGQALGIVATAAADPTSISLTDSLVAADPGQGSTTGAVGLTSMNTGGPVTLDALGSTLVAGSSAEAGLLATRSHSTDAAISVMLRNSVVRKNGAGGADIEADRATVAADHSSYTTVTAADAATVTTAGSGTNVSGDPLLAADSTLQTGSPLIDRGDVALVAPGELDLAGGPRSLDGNGDCVATPDIGAFERPSACQAQAPPNAAPAFSSARMTNKVFAPVPKGGKITIAKTKKRRVKRGTRFVYTLSEAAKVRIAIQRQLPGRRKGKRCVKPNRNNRHAKSCKRFKTVTTLSVNAKQGSNSTPFTGRAKGKALGPARYRARLVAADPLGAKSKTRTLSFRIVHG